VLYLYEMRVECITLAGDEKMRKFQLPFLAIMFLSTIACTTGRIELAKASNPTPTAITAFRECVGPDINNIVLVKSCSELAGHELDRAAETANASADSLRSTVVVVSPDPTTYGGGYGSYYPTPAAVMPTCPPGAYGCTSGAPQVATTGNTRPPGGYAPATTSGSGHR